jgi:hypothetical protein
MVHLRVHARLSLLVVHQHTCSHYRRIFCVNFTADSRFILSGSDDCNVRVWKAKASESLRRELPRESAKRDYRDALLARYGHMPEVKRIVRYAGRHMRARAVPVA